MPEKVRKIFLCTVAALLMTVSGSFALLLRVLSLGLLTNFCQTHIVANSSKIILRLMGIRLVAPARHELPQEQVLYTFNHNYLPDVLIITALGLPYTRFVLSTKTIKLLPLTLSALATGTLYIPEKKHRVKRLAFFRKTASLLQQKGFSLLASSEGVHDFVHGIAPFNKGIYHLAAVIGLPIAPLYFHVPEEMNPLEEFRFRRGTVRVDLLPLIPTHNWDLNQLEQHVEHVRQLYLDKYHEAHRETQTA